MRIAVAGGTGWTGKLVVSALRGQGDDPVVLARSAGVDLMTGSGLLSKLEGVEAVIDVTNLSTTSARKSVHFFETTTNNLLVAEAKAAVAHHVALSIVGVDRVDLGYYMGKRRQEELVLRHGEAPGGSARAATVAGTVLRATQFHEFAAQMLKRKGLLVVAPKMLSQPIALRELAEHLVELAHGEPLGMAPELAGPEEHLRMQDMIKQLAKVRGERRPVVSVGMPGKVGKQLSGGGLLPTGPGRRGKITFEAWLKGAA